MSDGPQSKVACIAKKQPRVTSSSDGSSVGMKRVRFHRNPRVFEVNAVGRQVPVRHRPREFSTVYRTSDDLPVSSKIEQHEAQVRARQLQETVKLHQDSDVAPSCGFCCGNDDTGDITCKECRFASGPKAVREVGRLPSIATAAPKAGVSWLVDSGSESDLVSKGMLHGYQRPELQSCWASDLADSSEWLLNEVAGVKLSALPDPVLPYVLDQTPAERCVDQGFVWPAASGKPSWYVLTEKSSSSTNMSKRILLIGSSSHGRESCQFLCMTLRLSWTTFMTGTVRWCSRTSSERRSKARLQRSAKPKKMRRKQQAPQQAPREWKPHPWVPGHSSNRNSPPQPFLEPEPTPSAKASSSGRPEASRQQSWSYNRDHYSARHEWSWWQGAWYYRDGAGGRSCRVARCRWCSILRDVAWECAFPCTAKRVFRLERFFKGLYIPQISRLKTISNRPPAGASEIYVQSRCSPARLRGV